MSMQTWMIGDVSVTRVEEMCEPGFEPAFLYPDWDPAVLDEHRAWLVPDCFDEAAGRFIASIHTWVVRTRHHTILVDTCTGNDKHRPAFERFHMRRQPYLERLAAAGVAPEDVDFVLCTHLHVDHCGWNTRLVDGRWAPTFPNARYVFSRAELDHWSGPAGQDGFNAGVFDDSVRPILEARLEMVIDGPHELGDGLFIEPAPGHTAGQVVLRLVRQGEEGVFTADVMHQPLQVYRPDWNSRFCALPAEARETRRRLLGHCADRACRLFPGHFAGRFSGHVMRRGEGFAWRFD